MDTPSYSASIKLAVIVTPVVAIAATGASVSEHSVVAEC